MRHVALLLLLIVCTLSHEAYAATLYVNNSGSPSCSDATTKASNSAASPWCTLGRAVWGNATRSTPSSAQAAAAGDIVLVTAGTYDTTQGSGTDNTPTYNPANSGSSGNPVTFRADGTVTLTYSGGTWGPVYGVDAVDYIIWDGFTVDEANAPSAMDSGTAVLNDTTGSQILNCTMTGNLTGSDGGTPTNHNSNHSGVRMNFATSVVVKNCTMTNYHTTVVNFINGSAIEIYASSDFIIENNNLSDSGTGVFMKDSGGTYGTAASAHSYVRFNRISDTVIGVLEFRNTFTASTWYFYVYQNIIYGSTAYGIEIRPFGGGTGPYNGRWINNTIDDCASGINLRVGGLDANANHLLQNNLVTNSAAYAVNQSDATSSDFDDSTLILLERNFYYVFPTAFAYTYDAGSAANRATLADFQTAHPAQDINSVSGTNPNYVNQAGRNYHLQAGSAALTAGRVVHSIGGSNGDTIPVGAYITGNETIGVVTAGASSRFTGAIRLSGGSVMP